VFVIEEEHEDHKGQKKHKMRKMHKEHKGDDSHEGHKEHKIEVIIDGDDSHEGLKEHDVEVIIKDENGNIIKDKNVFVKKGTKVIRLDSEGEGNIEKVYVIKKGKDGKTIKEEIIYEGDDTNTWIEKGEDGPKHEVRIKKVKDGKVIKERINLNDDGTHSWIEEENKDGSKHKIILKSDKSKDGMIFISSDGNENPLIMIDGKESTKEAMEKLNPDSIEKMEVLKGEKVTKDYGEKGKDGVIMITTKK